VRAEVIVVLAPGVEDALRFDRDPKTLAFKHFFAQPAVEAFDEGVRRVCPTE
jgi:hypothetical protein